MQLRTFLLAPILALALAACGASEEPQPLLGSTPKPSPEATATGAARSEGTPTVVPTATNPSSPTKAPATANEAARGTPTVAAQGLAATAAPTQPPAPTATPVPPTNTPVPQPTATPVPPTPIPPTPKPAPSCDPNYTGACVPPYPPDVNCGDIPVKNFRRVGGDPHGLDRDNDGIACES